MADAPQDQIAPLLNPEGWELLASLGPYREDEAFRLNASLRKAGHSPELVSAALTQSRLRTKAEAKFGEFARQMIFTQAGLEQATRLTVAARHAQRFAEAGVSMWRTSAAASAPTPWRSPPWTSRSRPWKWTRRRPPAPR